MSKVTTLYFKRTIKNSKNDSTLLYLVKHIRESYFSVKKVRNSLLSNKFSNISLRPENDLLLALKRFLKFCKKKKKWIESNFFAFISLSVPLEATVFLYYKHTR
jgi:hypothetical protein